MKIYGSGCEASSGAKRDMNDNDIELRSVRGGSIEVIM